MKLGLRNEIVVRAERNGCWTLPHRPRPDGYVRVAVWGKTQYAHRYVYDSLVAPVPSNMELDHLCRNRSCVNPDHMEIVTHAENCRRGIPRCSKLTHCKRGHELSGDNVYPHAGRRHCRTCRKEYVRG